MAKTKWVGFLFLVCVVAVTGGFAPSLDLSKSTTESPTTTQDGAMTPHFLNHKDSTYVSSQAGDTAMLDCQVFRLREKIVSWIRRIDDDIHLLTVGYQTYHNDKKKYVLNYEHPHNWKLQISNVQARDEGTYVCQVSTHPPQIRHVYLKVTMPGIEIRDKRGTVVTEKYYQVGSRIALQCVVNPAPPRTLVTWTKGTNTLDQKVERQLRRKFGSHAAFLGGADDSHDGVVDDPRPCFGGDGVEVRQGDFWFTKYLTPKLFVCG
ncbi:cell adhesion molecule 1-like isoform X2 [Oratosquilla oratoria]|uniref:cell adhesion molecule 1-like isoform X2 n=1 Tax=Oratosquilla oratoria TaxID=337810 RepID=UPI003F761DED